MEQPQRQIVGGEGRAAGPATDATRLQQALLTLTLRETDARVLLRKMLGLLVQLTNARGGVVFAVAEGAGAAADAPALQVLHSRIPTELQRGVPQLSEVLTRSAATVASTRRARCESLAELAGRVDVSRWVALSAPLFGQQATFGVITLVLDLGPSGAADPFLVVLQTVAGYFQFHWQRGISGRQQAITQHLAALLDLSSQCAAAADGNEAAFVAVNEMQRYLECQRVALSWWNGRSAKLTTISGQSTFDRRGDLAQALVAAAEECARQGEPVQWPVPDLKQPRPIDAAHQALCSAGQAGAVWTRPLVGPRGVVGAWTFTWEPDQSPRGTDEPVVAVTTGQLGPIFAALKRGDQGVLQRLADGSSRGTRRLVGRGHHTAKVVAAVLVAAVLVLCFWKVPHRVTASCVLQPVVSRAVSVPFDGILAESFVRPGDLVEAGMPLAALDDAELRLQLATVRAEERGAAIEAARHLANDNQADHQLAMAAGARHEARRELLERWLSQATVVSPIDGVVLQGDLDRARGAPVKTGEVLFEIAPVDRLYVETAVLDRDAARVRPGQEGRLALESRPELSLAFRVDRLRPDSEVRDQANTFVAEAVVDNSDGWLRPGMRGTAKITVGRRPVGWVLTHRIVDWLRMKWWQWSWW